MFLCWIQKLKNYKGAVQFYTFCMALFLSFFICISETKTSKPKLPLWHSCLSGINLIGSLLKIPVDVSLTKMQEKFILPFFFRCKQWQLKNKQMKVLRTTYKVGRFLYLSLKHQQECSYSLTNRRKENYFFNISILISCKTTLPNLRHLLWFI